MCSANYSLKIQPDIVFGRLQEGQDLLKYQQSLNGQATQQDPPGKQAAKRNEVQRTTLSKSIWGE
jgi:hypothetical protein